MGTALTGSSVASTYDALLKITDNGPVGGSLKTVTDGLGNDSALQVSTAGVKSTGTLDVTGASTLAAVSATSVTSSGAVSGTTGTFSGTLTPQALVDISGASAGQIKFPASQNASANANTLDDYEEGTWTPTLSGATTTTYTLQTGTYTKIGRLVVAHCRLTINSVGDGSKTLIVGLPFSASAQQSGAVSYFSGAATSLVWATAYTNGSTIQIGTMASASTATGTADFFASGTDVMLTVVYHV